MNLYQAIAKAGFNVNAENFLEAYSKAHEKYRIIRYEKLVEVTNAVWISDALTALGFKTNPEDARIKTAVNVFFENYLNSLELRPCVKKLLEKLAIAYKLGLISNFTYAPVIYAGLRKLDINRFFNTVLVSEEAGWRKPNKKIFQDTLKRLGVNAKETLYVGDSPLEDIKGAKDVGMKTIFIPSQFYSIDNLHESKQHPDLIFNDICEFCRNSQTSNKTQNYKKTKKADLNLLMRTR